MENNKTFSMLKGVKLSFVSRKVALVKLKERYAAFDNTAADVLIEDQIKWCDEMIKGLDTLMEESIIPTIPF